MIEALHIARREWLGYIYSPVTLVVLAVFLALLGYSFWLLVEVLALRGESDGSVLGLFFGGTFLFWLNVLVVTALLGMRLFAEERQRGSIELLMTLPVDEWQVVVGKFLGGLGLYASFWLPTTVYLVLLRSIAAEGRAPDLLPVLAGYGGTLLMGASAVAIALVVTITIRSQLLAALLAFGVLTLLLLGGALSDLLLRHGVVGELLGYCNWFRHMEDFGRGIVDSRTVVLHATIVGGALFVATKLLSTRRTT